ncbi:MAG: gephyrin-like molybdotransferase Glp [Planctomycetaceae bacterium]
MNKPTNNPRDVRMRGFATRSTVEDALAWIDAATTYPGWPGLERSTSETPGLPSQAQSSHPMRETIAVDRAVGRILAEDFVAEMNVPPFERSAMDGYAVIAEETTGASDYSPLPFKLVGKSMPGVPFDGTVKSGQTIRIMTGAPMPAGATGVVPVEYTTENDDNVEITLPLPEGKHVGRIGEDIKDGTVVLKAGRILRPQDLGVIASLGAGDVTVVRRPRVRIVTTGNELAVPGSDRTEFQIFDANTSILSALVERDGALLESTVRVEDTEAAIRDALTTGDVDVILVGGGSSVGAEDFAPQIVAEEGELAIHGIAMRPSSPTGLGRVGSSLVFLLPGNPVSCLCAYDFFAGRAIRKLGGRNGEWPREIVTAKLTRKISSIVGRLDYCRVALNGSDCEPIAISGASILSSTTRADGFVIVPAGSEGYGAGSEVTVFRY